MSWGPDAWTAGGQVFFKARPEKEATWNRKHQKPKTVGLVSCPRNITQLEDLVTWIPEKISRSGHLTCLLRSPLRHADPEVDQSLAVRRSHGPGSRGARTVRAMLNT